MLSSLSLLILLPLAISAQCRSKLLSDCHCGKIYEENDITFFAVNCTNLGVHDTKMLEALPAETEMLIFTGNHVPVLDVNIFGENLTKLKVIDMSNNGIREIKGKAFHHVSLVKRLILNHNNISISNEDDGNFHHARVFSNFYHLEELHLTNAFADNTDSALADNLHDIFVNSNLTKLYKLHLEQNEIRNFGDVNVFCDLPNLHDIYLGDNNIPRLNFNISCLSKLRYLDLENNNISAFTGEDLRQFDRKVPNGFTLELRGNPFRCDLALKYMYKWLQTTRVQIRAKDSLQCHQSKFDKYVLLRQLAVAKQTKVSQAITVLLIVLVSILVTLVGVFVFVKKEQVRSRFATVFTRKVHYTTIESQDV